VDELQQELEVRSRPIINAFGKTHHPMRIYLVSGWMNCSRSRRPALVQSECIWEVHHPMRIYLDSGWMNYSRSWRPDLVQSECFWKNSSPNENLSCFRLDELQQELEVKMAEIRKCGANYTALTTKLGTVRNKSNKM
jgi:hypothetical protein